MKYYTVYHIFCCNMSVFACPIIARSQCWLFDLGVNIHIFPQISALALKHPNLPPNLTSGTGQWFQRKYVKV